VGVCCLKHSILQKRKKKPQSWKKGEGEKKPGQKPQKKIKKKSLELKSLNKTNKGRLHKRRTMGVYPTIGDGCKTGLGVRGASKKV